MKYITLDFETYYDKDFSLSKITTEEYIRGKQFEVIGVSTKVDDGPIVWVSGTYKELKAHLDSLPWGDHLLLAQNTAFDAAILNWRFGIKPAGYLDTMSMAMAMHGLEQSVSLANLAKLYNEMDKGEQVKQYIGYHRKDFSPLELEDYGMYCSHDVELCYNIFNKMLPNFPKGELRVVDLTIRMFAEPTLELDERLLVEDLMQIRADKRGSLVTLMHLLGVKNEDDLKKQLMSNDKFAELLKSRGVEPPTKVSDKTGKEAWAFAKTDEEFTDLMDSEDPLIATLVATRLANKSTIGETRTEAYADIAGRGTYPFSLKYSGAMITHRWSGYDTNPQNLPRGSTLRKAIMAPDGYQLVVADLSNIELRLGMWLAGQHDAVEQIKEGMDLYRVFASEAFNLDYKKIGKDSNERFIAKVCCLSLIYGTGALKLRETIRIQSKGKTTVSEVEAERLKSLYREKNTNVADAWREGGHVLDWIKNNESHTVYGFLPVLGSAGIVKPNGLTLPYPNLTESFGAKGSEWHYDVRRGRATMKDKVYGSKVFQRVTQSLARDIMAEHTININKRYQVAGLVHDEVICVVPDGEVEEAKAYITKMMRTPPAWAPDLPLDCEVGSGKRYGSAK
jgi:DNA polymerase I-like protein with 3'-5' exonuclease and polymerase domains